jgi:hypothetical protein
MSLVPFPSKSPTPAMLQSEETEPRLPLLVNVVPFMSQM